MNEMKLYRTLQTHAGNINSLVVQLYKGEIPVAVALVAAKKENEILIEKIKEIESE